VKTAFSSGFAARCAERLRPFRSPGAEMPRRKPRGWRPATEGRRPSAQRAAKPLCPSRCFHTVSKARADAAPPSGTTEVVPWYDHRL